MSIFKELKRRNVIRVAIAYAIVAWLMIEVTSTVFPILNLPDWSVTLVTALLLIGFPLALIFAWAFEVTPEGIRFEKEVDRSESVTHVTGRRLDFVIIGVLVIALAFLAYDELVIEPADETPQAAANTQVEESAEIGAPELSVAVLPFVNMSADPDQEYFSDGISEELLNQLTKIRGLHVAGRTSSFSFKNKNEDLRVIGEELDVAHILEGSVRKAGERVRITVQLVKASDGYHLWSETYDRTLDDIFAIQEETAIAVAKALSITLGVGEGDLGVGGTRNFEAYDAYLAGISFFRQFGAEAAVRSIEQFEKAVALDPEYAHAWSELASIYLVAANFFIDDRTEDLVKKGEAAASRAIELAPEAVPSVLAAVQLQVLNRDWSLVEQYSTKALKLAPAEFQTNSNFAFFLMNVGRTEEAIEYFRRASRIEPLILLPVQNQAFAHESLGVFDKALQAYEHGKELIGQPAVLNGLVLVFAMEIGDRPLLEEKLNQLIDDDPGPRSILSSTMRSLLDSPEAARAELHRFNADPDFDFPLTQSAIAVWASYFDDDELALRIYQDLYSAREFVVYAIWRYIHKDMRRLPGFKDLVRDLGLVDYWRATGNWGKFCRPLGHDDFECE
jgi:TolB-like protein/tetratricopeptide (TPR) repeat protein